MACIGDAPSHRLYLRGFHTTLISSPLGRVPGVLVLERIDERPVIQRSVGVSVGQGVFPVDPTADEVVIDRDIEAVFESLGSTVAIWAPACLASMIRCACGLK